MQKMPQNIDELIELINENTVFKFKIKVGANSKVNLIDFNDEIIKVKIQAPAIEGKANKALINFLADELKVPKSKIKIVNGEKSSIKTIQILK